MPKVIKKTKSQIAGSIFKFDYNKIPEGTKLDHAVNYRKIVGEAQDVDLKSPDLFEKMQGLVWKMIKTCDIDGGVGLAAPQLGIPKKAIIMVGFEDPYLWAFDGNFTLCLNPTFKAIEGTEKTTEAESCLSIPGQSFRINRYKEISVSYWSFDEQKTLTNYVDRLEGYPARIYQHERDHLFAVNIADLHERQFGHIKKKKKSIR